MASFSEYIAARDAARHAVTECLDGMGAGAARTEFLGVCVDRWFGQSEAAAQSAVAATGRVQDAHVRRLRQVAETFGAEVADHGER